MNRITGVWFEVAGLTALIFSVLFEIVLDDAAYYDAESLLDYSFVLAVTSVFALTGIALILLWREPPVERGSVFLLLAGIGAITAGVGNLLEDIFEVGSAEWAFFGGGLVMMVSLIVAGVTALTVGSPNRWSGLFLLLGVSGAFLGFGVVIMGVSWVLFGFWIIFQHRALVAAVSIAAVPLIAAGIYVNL